ncbi:MAG: hypothetical protein JO264_04410 [Acidisphaera sp.]|nr:hypothetical protein [Acidisphaera sp.]
MNHILQVFMLPGEMVGRLLGARATEDRMMIRTLINMLVWNAVVVIGAFLIFR